MAEDTPLSSRSRVPGRSALIAIFVVVTASLLVGYYLFLRVDYAPIYTALKPADASAIVAELETKGVPHRLSDGGTTILVPSAQADSVRVAVAGSEIPMKGSVGFELFNKSDMGLTDFAQKINYQRALQGELARSIMMMEGVETARVHLAMPERALFRGSQTPPKAAVEVISKPGRTMTRDRVAGIQSLVAASVPELPLSEVVVLDGAGHVISQAAAAASFELDEQSALQSYFTARARTALAKQLPGVRFTVRASALRIGPQVAAIVDAGGASRSRDFVLHIVITTPAQLQADDEDVARRAIATAVELDASRGDTIAFEVGALAPVPARAALPAYPVASGDMSGATPAAVSSASGSLTWWTLGLLAAALAGLLIIRRRRDEQVDPSHDALVDRIKRQLGSSEAVDATR